MSAQETIARVLRLTEVDMVGAEEILAEAERMGAREAAAYWRGRLHGLRVSRGRLVGRPEGPTPLGTGLEEETA